VVRGSLEVGEQVRNLLHRGNGGRPTTQEPADDVAATAGSSSPASSSSTDSNSSRGDSSDGDAGGS
jgi:hypothetical protein